MKLHRLTNVTLENVVRDNLFIGTSSHLTAFVVTLMGANRAQDASNS